MIKSTKLTEESFRSKDIVLFIENNNNKNSFCDKNIISLLKKLKNKNIILFFSAYCLYFLSLEGCYEGVDLCPRRMNWIVLKVSELIISCIILTSMILLILHKKLSKLNFLHIIIIFSFFFLYSHGLDFHDHGLFNIIFYYALMAILIVFILPFNLLFFFFKKKNKIIIFFIFIIIGIFIFFILFLIIMPTSCKDWSKGLNNTSIENNITKYGCQIQIPKKCAYHIFSKFFDYTKLIKKDCKKYKQHNSKQKLLGLSQSPHLNDKVNRIGYPLTNKDPICLLDFIDNDNLIMKYFLNNLVDMDNQTLINEFLKDKKPEVEVDFLNDTQGKIKINLNYNKTLSEERKLLEKNSTPYSNNILIIYIDSVSRSNSIRQLKKTLSFFEQFMPYKGNFCKKYPEENFHSFQFFKYYSFALYTDSNYPPLFYGINKKENNNMVSITKYLNEKGYVSCYISDYCDKDNIRTLHNLTFEEIHDHQFILCDPNKEHFNTNLIKCLYGKQNAEHLYEYAEQFWRKYKSNRKYLSIITNEGHEGTLRVISYVDNIIYTFLNNLFNDNLLKDSTIFLLSDHGAGMPSLYMPYDFYRIERYLPMLYIIVNDRKNTSYDMQYKYIYENQQTFITAFDIYNTIGNILIGENYIYLNNKTKFNDTPKSEHGISLFDKINPKERYTQKYSNIDLILDYSCK